MYNNNAINKQHYLMLCELHYPGRHGKTEDSDPNIETHYLVYDRFDSISWISYSHLEEYDTDSEDEYNNNAFIRMKDEMKWLRQHYSNPFDNLYSENHPTIRNYHNIIKHPNYIKPEIGEIINLPTGHAVCIIKTMWLRVIQRAWKRLFKERKQVIQMRCRFQSLKHREITGRWPDNCRHWPDLQGLLTNRGRVTG